MSRTTRLTATLVALLLVASVTVWIITRDHSEPSTWLFTGNAQSSALTKTSLTLTGIDEDVVAFTDRPERDAAVLSPDVLATYWDEWFPTSEPNAVLVEHDPQGQADSTVLTLANPTITGTAPNRSVTFDATVITDEPPEHLAHLAGPLHDTPPTSTGEVSLFIDGATSVTVSNGEGGTVSIPLTYHLQNAIMSQYCPPACRM